MRICAERHKLLWWQNSPRRQRSRMEMTMRKKRNTGFFRNLFRGLFFGQNTMDPPVIEEEPVRSPMRMILIQYRDNKVAMTGLVVFVLIFLACFILPILYPLDPSYQDVTQQNLPPGFSQQKVPRALRQNAKQIDAGAAFSIGIDQNGTVYLWGILDDKLKALQEDGTLRTWGNNRFSLDQVPESVQGRSDIKQIEAGYQISMVVTEGGELFVWGNENLISIETGKVQGNVEKIVSNTTTALALTKDRQVVSLSAKESTFDAVPQEIQGRAVDLAATDKSAAVLTEDGRITVWGSQDFGVQEIPQKVQGATVAIEAGRSHFTVLLKDGRVVSWGRNNFHQTDVPAEAETAASIHAGYYQNYVIREDGSVASWGLKGYLMGTDDFGRDVFTRLVSGGRLTMTIGAIAVIISTLIGVLIGGFSGYYGGKIDNILMRFAEIVGAIPFLPLAMILSSIVGNNVSELRRISLIMVILGVLSWPGLARLVRAQILAEREKEFVTAAKAMGIRELSIIFRHILHNVVTVIIVNTTLNFASCLLTESSLSFLGFGVVEPNPTWGNMLTGSQASTVIVNFWWRWVFPALALSLATISINLIGDGLRDAIDPKSNER